MKIKNIKRRPKVWLYPSAVEREYVKTLEAITDSVINEVDKFCKKQQENYRLLIRQDGLNEWLEEAFTELLSAMQFFVGDSEIQRLVSGLLGEANRFNKKQFHQTLKKAYGVDIFTSEQWLLEQLKLFELQNINLIKSIPTQLHEKLRYKFVDAVQKGKRWEEVAKEIEELTGATRKRSRLIARDQIGKLNGQLTQLRQKQIGVKSYIWRTSLDERVRKLHVSREGEQFDWDNPPDDGHPGEAINCRCYAEAVLPDLEELLQSQGAMAVKVEEPDVVNITSFKPLGEEKILPKDLPSVINIGKSIHQKYKDVLDEAIANGKPHEGVMEIMRREGVELGGVAKVVGKEKRAISEITEAVSRYPKAWIEKSNEFGNVIVKEKAIRAYQLYIPIGTPKQQLSNMFAAEKSVKPFKTMFNKGLIKDGDSLIVSDITPGYSTLDKRISTSVHEYGHRLQSLFPEIDKLFHELWEERTRGDKYELLSILTGNKNYGAEMTKRDHFPSPYYGKVYRDNKNSWGKDRPLEMLAMTFEALLGGNSRKFDELYENDYELFSLGLSILARFNL